MTVLAAINLAIAAGCLIVFALLARKEKTAFRYVHMVACLVLAYMIYLYWLTMAGTPSISAYQRPATGLLLALLLSVGIHEFYNR
jgi:hypothetical protein